MKNILHIQFLLLFLSLTVHSQNTFEFNLKGEQDQVPGAMIEDSQGNIIFTVWNNQYAEILKLNQNGDIIDSVKIFNSENSKCDLFSMLKSENDEFYAFGYWEENSEFYFWVTKFDADFNLILNSKFPVDGRVVTVYSYSIYNSEGNIVSVMPYETNPPNTKLVIYEINQSGELIQFRNLESYGNGIIYSCDLIEVEPNEYRIYTSSSLQKTICYCNEVNSDFDLIDSYTLPWYLGDLTTVKKINDTSLIIAGKKILFENNDDFQLGIIETDLQNNLLISNDFGKTDTNDYPGNHNTMDFLEIDNIYYGGTSNLTYPYFSNIPSWLLLNKIDENLNLKWQKYYGGDACYLLMSILATLDGGCVMAGSRYDYQTQNQERDVYLIKVNEDGLITWAHNIPEITKEILIYPNPGNDLIHIKSFQNTLTIELYNNNGQQTISHKITNQNITLNTRNLNSGIYFYRILNDKNKTIETGKWIKN